MAAAAHGVGVNSAGLTPAVTVRADSSRFFGDILEGTESTPDERRVITGNTNQAAHEIRSAYAPARLEIRRDPLDFELDLRRFRTLGVELSLMSVRVDVMIAAPPPRDCYIIAVPISGNVTVGNRNQKHVLSRTTGIVMSPSHPVFFSDWSADFRQLCVRISKSRVDSALRAMLGMPPRESLEFAFALDLAAQSTKPLMRALEIAALEVLEGDESTARVAMASSISELVVNALLLSQDHSSSEALKRPAVDPDFPEPLRLAQRFVIDHAAEPLTVRDIADAARLSVRMLEEGFARYLHVSPMAFLREVRLVLAQNDLRKAMPEEVTVSTVAARWGFRHAGRFSVTYRERFGISPSKELRTRTSGSEIKFPVH